MSGLLEKLPDLILQAVDANPLLGYGAITLVMLLENVVPPIPSEVVMPLAGFLVQQGKLELVPTVLAGVLGTVLGAWFWYGVGRLINEERLEDWLRRHGRWLGLKADDLARSRRWFNRHGVAVVFWGRIVPGVRTLVSLPAGIEMMPQAQFLAWTVAGSMLWVLMLTLAGQALGEGYRRVGATIGQITEAIAPLLIGSAIVLVGWMIYRALQKKGRS
ncbi:MAG: DedA family protein [Cyanobacteriota bacterium]|nr:DedA family protein [Cyanobacteriota bacterium]